MKTCTFDEALLHLAKPGGYIAGQSIVHHVWAHPVTISSGQESCAACPKHRIQWRSQAPAPVLERDLARAIRHLEQRDLARVRRTPGARTGARTTGARTLGKASTCPLVNRQGCENLRVHALQAVQTRRSGEDTELELNNSTHVLSHWNSCINAVCWNILLPGECSARGCCGIF